MEDRASIKEAIKAKAVEIFSEKGYHGTSIRDIAKAAGCSLPMLYYYYENKSTLFEEVAYHDFIRLIDRLNSSITVGVSVENLYLQAFKQRKELNAYDKGVYKLSYKVWLGFDGSKEVREKLMKWEHERIDRTKMILLKTCSNSDVLPVFSRVVARVVENIMEKIILLDEDISDDEIEKELNFIMSSVKDK